jgi:ferric-dicitrate binding protein FerR (iron transport regulator)
MRGIKHDEADLLAVEVEAGRADETDRIRLELHLQECDACARRHTHIVRIGDALRSESTNAHTSASDASIAMQAVMRSREDSRAPARRVVTPAAIAATLVLAAAAGAVWIVFRAPQVAPGADVASVEGQTMESSSARDPSETVVRTEPAPADAPLDSAGLTPICRGVVARLGHGARARVARSEPNLCHVMLTDGVVRLHVDPDARTRTRVTSPRATVEVVGTAFAVEEGEHLTSVVVERGVVRVESEAGQIRVLAGQEARIGAHPGDVPEIVPAGEKALSAIAEELGLERNSPTLAHLANPPKPRVEISTARISELRTMVREGRTAEARAEAEDDRSRTSSSRWESELLTIIAESHLAEEAYDDALRSYVRAAEGSPSSTTANAIFAAAGLALDRLGRPQEALNLFDRYLNEYPDGALRETATIERCRAIRAEGRPERASRCAALYLEWFPEGRFRALAERMIDR